MNLNEAFEKLALKYGSHTAAAEAIGYTPEYYRMLRNGRADVNKRAENYILNAAMGEEGPSHASLN